MDYLNDSWMDSSGISFIFCSLVTFLLICLFHLISYVLISALDRNILKRVFIGFILFHFYPSVCASPLENAGRVVLSL